MPDLSHLSRYDIVAAALQAGLLLVTLATVGVYLVKRSGNRTANLFFASLLLAFGGCIGALVLEHLALTTRFPRLRYLPVWLTLAIGPSWFYYVKLSLFPAYKVRWSDAKHAVFPLAQWLSYVYCFVAGRDGLRQEFLFGFAASTFEQALFLGSVFGYLFGAYRYLRFRAREIGEHRERWDYWRVRQLRHVQRVLVVLLVFNFFFVAYNFAVEQSSGAGLLHLRGFYASSSLSFGLILLYLLRGVAHRQHFSAMVPQEALAAFAKTHGRDAGPAGRLRILMEDGRGFRDPNAHEVRVARSVGVEPGALDVLAQALGATSIVAYVRRLRLAEVSRQRAAGRSLRVAILEAGYGSRRAARGGLRAPAAPRGSTPARG